jgi:hypothetical protein
LLECDDDIATGLARYVELRKPTRDIFMEATVKSFEWYEDIGKRMELDVVEFTRDFLTRTGRVDDERLRSYVPSFYNTYMAVHPATPAGG